MLVNKIFHDSCVFCYGSIFISTSEATFHAMTHTFLSIYVMQIIRTHKLSYSAQFDLEKPIKIRIVTLMKCTCANGTEVQGEEADREYTPDLTGKQSPLHH